MENRLHVNDCPAMKGNKMDTIALDVSATPHLVSQVMFRCIDVQRVIEVQQVLEDRGGVGAAGEGTEREPTSDDYE